MSGDVCRTVDGVHIPGCMGCAVRGHSYCTCKSSRAVADHRVAQLERRVKQLEQQISALLSRPSDAQAPGPARGGVGGTDGNKEK